MKFLKSITAAALLATAISSGAMAAIDLSDKSLDVDAIIAKLPVQAEANGVYEVTITPELIDARGDLKAYNSIDADPDVKGSADKFTHSLGYMIDKLVAATPGKTDQEVKDYLNGAGSPVVVKLTLKLSTEQARLNASVNKAINDLLGKLDPETKEHKEAAEFLKLVSTPDTLEVLSNKKKVTYKSIFDKYAAAKDKAESAKIDAEIAALKSADDKKTFAEMLAEAKAEVNHLGAAASDAQIKEHHAKLQAAYLKGKGEVLPVTPEQDAGGELVALIESLFKSKRLEYSAATIKNAADLKDKAKMAVLVKVISDRLAKVEGLEADLEEAREQAAAGGAGAGMAGLGGQHDGKKDGAAAAHHDGDLFE